MEKHRRLSLTLIALFAIASAGCTMQPAPGSIGILPPRAVPTPPSLVAPLRPYNWTDAAGSGSCVHASTCYNLLHSGRAADAATWRRSHAGGETSTTIRQYHDAAGLRYVFTLNADPRLLDWATQTRRSALIWYYPAHCVNFVGFSTVEGRAVANIVDNNRPTQLIRIDRATFLSNWASYGGFALALADPPIPPPLFDAIERRQL
jgi:hypothetical protein